MAWVERNGRRYLYRTYRRDGRVVREYLGCGPVAELAAQWDELKRQRVADAASDARAELAAYRAEIDGLVRSADAADGPLREVVAILMAADGYHRPRRNRWRKRRRPLMASESRKINKDLAALIERVKETGMVPAGVRPDPLIQCEAPKTDPGRSSCSPRPGQPRPAARPRSRWNAVSGTGGGWGGSGTSAGRRRSS